MKKYPKYKDSGVEWIGEIPEYWKIRRGKDVLFFLNGYPFSSKLFSKNRHDGFPLIRIRDLKDKDLSTFYKGKIVEDVLIENGDIIIGMDGDFSTVIWKKGKALLNQRLCRIEGINGLNSKYLFYLLPFYLKMINDLTYFTTVKHLSTNDLKSKKIILPPDSEQTQIAKYLDKKTQQIDGLIAKKERLIELLEEERTALINQAVTKGLDSNAPMKDAGIDWLGETPKHWKYTRMKFISSLKGRQGWQGLKSDEYKETGPYVLSSAHFDEYKIDWEKCPRVSQERYERDEHIQLKQGDVLLMKDGANMGKLAIIDNMPGPACLNSHLLLFRPLSLNGAFCYFSRYIFYHMTCVFFQDYILANGTGATFLGVSQQAIGDYPIIIPPLKEQIEIVDYIDESTSRIDYILKKIKKEIRLLKEYRATLISEVVTGKVDVREEILIEQ